jgi:hypothetical protein
VHFLNNIKRCTNHARYNFAKKGDLGQFWRSMLGLFDLVDLQLFELVDHIGSVFAGFDLFIDRKDFAIFSNVKCPAFRKAAKAYGIFFHQSVGQRRFAGRITQDRIVQFQRCCKFLVRLLLIAACCKVGDVIGLDLFADLTERQTLSCSSNGKGLGEPGYDNGLFPLIIRQLVDHSIASLKFKIRSNITHLGCL